MDELDKSLEDPDLKPELRERLEKVKTLQQQLCELDKDKANLEVTLSGMWKYSTHERKTSLGFSFCYFASDKWKLISECHCSHAIRLPITIYLKKIMWLQFQGWNQTSWWHIISCVSTFGFPLHKKTVPLLILFALQRYTIQVWLL